MVVPGTLLTPSGSTYPRPQPCASAAANPPQRQFMTRYITHDTKVKSRILHSPHERRLRRNRLRSGWQAHWTDIYCPSPSYDPYELPPGPFTQLGPKDHENAGISFQTLEVVTPESTLLLLFNCVTRANKETIVCVEGHVDSADHLLKVHVISAGKRSE